MAEERHLPPGDARWMKAAPFMEHQASQEILLVDDSRKSDTPHFQFISFSLILLKVLTKP